MATTNTLGRYNRQELIEGWDQNKLRNARVAIIGAGTLAQYTILPLAALGIGNLRIIGNEKAKGEENEEEGKDLFLDMKLTGNVSTSLEEILNKVNPDVDVIGLKSSIANKSSLYFLKDIDLVIDATNSPSSKALIYDYCKLNNIQMFSISCDEQFGRIVKADARKKDIKLLMPDLANKKQGDLISMVLGGLITEEVKKVLMQNNNQLEIPLYYNLTSPNRFSYEVLKTPESEEGEFFDKRVLLIGAGALANFAGPGLAKMGVGRIDIMDFDTIEETNLNRQILYYDSVGQNKAEVLAKKLKIISNGKTRTTAMNERFDATTELNAKYDLIFDCVDNFETRAVLSDYAVKNKIPLISGGTSVEAGQVSIYVPNKTSSINYQLKLKENAKNEEERRSHSCINAPNPSVIMTNQVIGGIMVAEARTVFNPEKYGKPINGILKYGTNLDARLGVNNISEVVE